MLPQKIFKFRVLEMPFHAFLEEHFRQRNTKENVVVSLFFYPSLVLWIRYNVYEKGVKQ